MSFWSKAAAVVGRVPETDARLSPVGPSVTCIPVIPDISSAWNLFYDASAVARWLIRLALSALWRLSVFARDGDLRYLARVLVRWTCITHLSTYPPTSNRPHCNTFCFAIYLEGCQKDNYTRHAVHQHKNKLWTHIIIHNMQTNLASIWVTLKYYRNTQN